jgi:hypothetical protein
VKDLSNLGGHLRVCVTALQSMGRPPRHDGHDGVVDTRKQAGPYRLSEREPRVVGCEPEIAH